MSTMDGGSGCSYPDDRRARTLEDGGLLTPRFPDAGTIAADTAGPGYAIYHDAIAEAALEQMRRFWLPYFERRRPRRGVVRGMLRLGEPNFNSYTDSRYWCLYRHFDFLWNVAPEPTTRELGIAVHRRRNDVQGFSASDGLFFSPSCYGIYISTSYYPPHRGHLQPHADGHRGVEKPILHYMVPITLKGIDYVGGGMFIVDTRGRKIDVDGQMRPGSIVFYDGRREHGVDAIVPRPRATLGRLGSFAIPTFFKTQEELPRPLRLAESFYLRVRRRLASPPPVGAGSPPVA